MTIPLDVATSHPCVICRVPCVVSHTPWLWRCPQCGLECSLLDDAAWNGTELIGWQDGSEEFLAPFRAASAEIALDVAESVMPLHGRRLLDIGCAAGWFMRAASWRGMQVVGIEPDDAIARRARAVGLDVRTHRFPLGIARDEVFDMVSLNDVLEHLPDPKAVLADVRAHLVDGGLLMLIVPCRTGILYRSARLLARSGWHTPLDRLWQRGFTSPHLYYWDDRTLRTLAASHGFSQQAQRGFDAYQLRGLWARINEGERFSRPLAMCAWLLLAAGLPLLRLLPRDIALHVYRREESA